MAKTTFHPNAPKRLARAFRKAGSYHATAEALGVNVRYVHDLLRKGIEPVNPEVRVKLFLPKTRRKRKDERRKRAPVAAEVHWWRTRQPDERRNMIAILFEASKDADRDL